jgi:FkbM family methyltransferase
MIKSAIKSMLSQDAVDNMSYYINNYFGGWALKSYSQEGEDMILRRLFEKQTRGFYVDVGAHHPKRFSNTYFFYKKGWNGINIDAMPGSMDLFQRLRPRDINLEKPIAKCKQVLTYYMFNEPALNGFSKELSGQRNGQGQYFIKATKEIETTTLEDVLDNNLPFGKEIDFLSIDVEGFDFMVLKSNNFEKYKPKVILIEVLGCCLDEIFDSEIVLFLAQHDYSVFAKTVKTVFFKRNKNIY